MDDNTFKLLKALIDSAPALIGGIGAMVASYFSWKTHGIAKENNVLTKQVEHNTNGMKDELVEATKLASFAAGKVSERAKPNNSELGDGTHEKL